MCYYNSQGIKVKKSNGSYFIYKNPTKKNTMKKYKIQQYEVFKTVILYL